MTNERTQTAARDTRERASHQGECTHGAPAAASSAQAAQAPANSAQAAQTATSCAPSVPHNVNKQLPCLLRAEHLGIKHLSGKEFWDVSLRVAPHQILALSGEHGTGKTALLLSLAGVMRTTHGSIHIMELPAQHYRSTLRISSGRMHARRTRSCELRASRTSARELRASCTNSHKLRAIRSPQRKQAAPLPAARRASGHQTPVWQGILGRVAARCSPSNTCAFRRARNG